MSTTPYFAPIIVRTVVTVHPEDPDKGLGAMTEAHATVFFDPRVVIDGREIISATVEQQWGEYATAAPYVVAKGYTLKANGTRDGRQKRPESLYLVDDATRALIAQSLADDALWAQTKDSAEQLWLSMVGEGQWAKGWKADAS